MTPSIEQRLASMIRAMTDIILPELESSKGLAKEQASLVLGHLTVLQQQLDHAPSYEVLELTSTRKLADQLLDIAEGGLETTKASEALKTALENDKTGFDSPAGVRYRLEALNQAIEDLILASGQDAAEGFVTSSSSIILEFGKAQSLRDRTFFQAMNYEAAGTVLPSISEMMESFEESIK